ncbi:MAG: 6-phosphogluconate dehydrogenase [Gammaproteobacteria bacterium]|nr:6-phosphogluconate dehydrogenase [Gammaproteobacteria bacterium]
MSTHDSLKSHTIGWIGTGRMGFAMARRLLEAGCDVAVYNRTRSKAQPLAGLGAKVVDSAADLGDRDIVFSMVSTGDDLNEVVSGKQGVLAGRSVPKLLVDCSSVSERASSMVRARALERGVRMIAAPVSGNAKVVEAGKLSIVASGSRDAFAIVEPYLNALGTGVTYVGDGELARMVKICHNLLLGILTQALAEITVLAEKGGVSRHDFLEFISGSVLGSVFLRYKMPAFVNLDMTPTFTPVLLRKDLDLGLKAGEELGVPLPLTALTREYVQKTVDAGLKDRDFAVLLLEQARAAGLELKPENVPVNDGL